MTIAQDTSTEQIRRRRRSYRPVRRRSAEAPVASKLRRTVVISLFAAVVMMQVALMAWSIGGLPVRAMLAGGMLVVLGILDRPAMYRCWVRHKNLLGLTLGLAALAIFVSLVNGIEPDELVRQVSEIHIQTVVSLLLGAMVAEICGAGAVIVVLVSATVLSAIFAAAQFFGIEAAWTVRANLATFSDEMVKYGRDRALGLSLSVITLGTQLCLALAAVVIWRHRMNEEKGLSAKVDPIVALAVALFIFACLASGNRSPILGAVLFFALYAVRNRPGLLMVIIPLGAIAIPLTDVLFNTLESTGLRAFQTGDKSSEGRTTLAYYGLWLFLDNPIGYGLGFVPQRYWAEHWDAVSNMPDPEVIRYFELHNYVLNMLNYYGVGILAAVPFAVSLMWRRKAYLLAFLPYVTHIVFHNYGPYQNDTFIMFVIAAACGPVLGESLGPSRARRRRQGAHGASMEPSRVPTTVIRPKA